MRVLLLALMIALLPVRGWMGDAMAVSMAAQQVVTASADTSSAAMPEDCPMQMQAMAAGEAESENSGSLDTSVMTGNATQCNCDTCELCLALASGSVFLTPPMSFVPPVGATVAGPLFVSADRTTGLKPPIS